MGHNDSPFVSFSLLSLSFCVWILKVPSGVVRNVSHAMRYEYSLRTKDAQTKNNNNKRKAQLREAQSTLTETLTASGQ